MPAVHTGTLQEVVSSSAAVDQRPPDLSQPHLTKVRARAGLLRRRASRTQWQWRWPDQRVVAAPNNSGTRRTLDSPLEAMDDENGQADGAFVQTLPMEVAHLLPQ